MKKRLRKASFIMLILGIVFVVFAFLTMGVPIEYPNWLFNILKIIYKVYPFVMVSLFIASFFIKDEK